MNVDIELMKESQNDETPKLHDDDNLFRKQGPGMFRCRKEEKETWEHIWHNEVTIDEIVQESIYRFERSLEDDDQHDEVKILRNYNFDFIRILESLSIILRGKSRIWEILRGVYNENFNLLANKKEEKAIIKRLWNFIYEEFKNRIWIPRCKEIKRLETKEGIQKMDLRKKRNRKDEDVTLDNDIEKEKSTKIEKHNKY
ncbi:hypothetical protein RhiirA5_438521 [Rhizophagus irregularis]|uniref:Uncharacterized protein n=1 Tax=Rhizophagus irregularis TaxID=588596 RepID=A0A2N0NJ17_9GLOM|nr:hypothetical protein RhiirA5_438521 [Rhizophagus irregularis]